MVEKLQNSIVNSKTARWVVLTLASLLMLSAYFITDVLSPLKSMLERDLGWSSTDYGTFAGSYAFFNVVLLMLIFGGMLLDKMGVRFTGLFASAVMVVGVAIKYYAISTMSLSTEMLSIFGYDISVQFLLSCFGYAVFGVGIEIAGITCSKLIVKWFTGKELALAMGLEMACARIGTGLALGLTPLLVKWTGSISMPILIGLLMLIIGTLCFLVFTVLDKKFDKEMAIINPISDEQKESDSFKISDIFDIIKIKAFWYIAILCVLFYSAVFPFLKYASDLMTNTFNVDPELAGQIPSILPFGTILLTPIFGTIYDRKGFGASIMILGSIMLIFIHTLFAFPLINSWIYALVLIIMLGIAFSLVPSAMWPSVPKIIPQNKLGTAYALIFWTQNIGLMIIPMLIGFVLDRYCKLADGGYDYTLPMAMFACLGVASLIFALLLKREDKIKNYGLEQPNIKK